MSEIRLIRTSSGALVPLDDDEAAKLKRIKAGSVVTAKIVQMRNGAFFRKWWALAKFAFDIWSETVPQQEYKGQAVQPEFERFRRDLTILAGYFRPVFAANGEMRLEAESLSWAEMDEARFERLYSATINAILAKILSGMTEEALRAHVDQVMRFDS
jgi:hypothetical protein